MSNFNKIFLIGNLTRDPEIRQTSKGKRVATFGLATNHKYRKADGTAGERVCFVDVVVWEKLAENCEKYLKKGKLIFVEGRLEYRSWETDGKIQSKLSVYAQTVEFLSPPSNADGPDEKRL